MARLTLEEKLARIEDVFVGLWNYRASRGRPSWTATYLFQGRYHDTRHYDTPSEALDAAYRGAQRLKSKHGDPFACPSCGKHQPKLAVAATGRQTESRSKSRS